MQRVSRFILVSRRILAVLGFKGGNHWIFSSYDHNLAFRQSWTTRSAHRMAFLSFPSLRDMGSQSHTAEIVSLAAYDEFRSWRDLPWKSRGAEYERLKERVADELISLVERKYPGFRDLVEFSELSTPLSVETFTGHQSGNIYGVPMTPNNVRLRGFSPRTQLKNFYLTGSDVLAPGIAGAMMGGVSTTAAVLGFGIIPELFGGKAVPARGLDLKDRILAAD